MGREEGKSKLPIITETQQLLKQVEKHPGESALRIGQEPQGLLGYFWNLNLFLFLPRF